MKRILITGANSYIGTSFENYMKQWPDQYQVDTVDMKDGSWWEKDFSPYDVVFHVAGIAHIKETKKNTELYYSVNRNLAIDTAKKAKKYGVKQFVFLSSMSVYGMDIGVISKKTKPNPKSNYGKSKYLAEIEINKLADDDFLISIFRPPMVYGKDCKGNYQTLSKWAKKLPVFPDIKNERSMIYIDNLCNYVRKIIDESKNGIFLPQDSEYICTSKMVKAIANVYDNKMKMMKCLNWMIKLIPLKFIKKIFGSLVYETNEYMLNPVKTLEQAVRLTEI